MELVFEHDPVSRESIDQLDHVEPLLREELRQFFPPDATLKLLGATASICDLKNVRASDQLRISILVCASIFLILANRIGYSRLYGLG